jgi:hypothetical protein
MDTIHIIPTKEEVFYLYDIEFGVKRFANGKAKDIEGYQAEIFKIGGPILIPHIHNNVINGEINSNHISLMIKFFR